jgi:hypothetical protein
MPYDSPKAIRRRQQAAENKAARRRSRQPIGFTYSTDKEWDLTCDTHIGYLCAYAEEGQCDSAGRHARHLVHMAVIRRAHMIMCNLGIRSYWKAAAIARHELLNVEVA